MDKYSELLKVFRDSSVFTDREIGLIENMLLYASNNPHGLPGHNIMLIAAKLVHLMNESRVNIYELLNHLRESQEKATEAYIAAYIKVNGQEGSEDLKKLLDEFSLGVEGLFVSKLDILSSGRSV